MLIATGVVGYNYTNQMARNSKTVYDDLLTPINQMGTIRVNIRAGASYMLQTTMKRLDQAKFEEVHAKLKERIASNQDRLPSWKRLTLTRSNSKYSKNSKSSMPFILSNAIKCLNLP